VFGQVRQGYDLSWHFWSLHEDPFVKALPKRFERIPVVTLPLALR
jgi:hypothetical protein